MTLKQWLKATETTQGALARKLNCNRMVVWRYLQGRIPAADKIAAIHRVTRGVVTANDFHGQGRRK
jgi:transcriptional regulator with XRE-family HTH domain